MTGLSGGVGVDRIAPRPALSRRPSSTPSRPRRLACLVAGLVCTLGLLSGVALRTNDIGHHRVHATATATVIADGHGTSARGDQHLVAAGSVTVSRALRPSGLATSTTSSVDVTTLDTVRTRGPPASA